MSRSILAADLGGTNARMAVVGDDGRVLFGVRGSTPESPTPEATTSFLVDLADECRRHDDSLDIIGFGLAVPALVDTGSGTILSSPNLPNLDGFAIGDRLSELTGLPVFLENDATAAAIGEHWLGASRDHDNAINLTLGTGVGGGLIIDGRPFRGIDGTAGEIGHICVEPFGPACGCGSRGCLEQFASGNAIVRMAGEAADGDPGTMLKELTDPTPHEIFELAVRGDRAAIRIFDTVGFYLGIALAGLVNVLNPEVIVIGGGVANSWELFSGQMRVELEKRAFQPPANRVKLVRGALGDDAGILGVARAAAGANPRPIGNFA